MTNLARMPWDRQPDENDAQWEAFVIFRDMGPERNMLAVAQARGKKNPDTIAKWSSKHNWQHRVAEWSREQDRVRREATLDEVAVMAKRHAHAAEQSMAALMLPVEAVLRRIANDPQALEELSTGKLTDLIATVGRVTAVIPAIMAAERTARGLASQRVEYVGLELEVTVDTTASRLERLLGILGEAGVLTLGPSTADGPDPTVDPPD